jgi:hypothetical protein
MSDEKLTVKELVFRAETVVGLGKFLLAVFVVAVPTWVKLTTYSEATLALQKDFAESQKKQIQMDLTVQKLTGDSASLQKTVDELRTVTAKQIEEVKVSQKEQWKLGTETSADVKVLLERTKK